MSELLVIGLAVILFLPWIAGNVLHEAGADRCPDKETRT